MVRALERAIAKPRIIIHEQIRCMAYPDIARRDHFIVAQHMRAPRLAHQENPPDNALDVDVGCALQPASIRFWDGMTRYIGRSRRSLRARDADVYRRIDIDSLPARLLGAAAANPDRAEYQGHKQVAVA